MSFCRPAGAQCTVDGAQTYQVIDGFGANINHRSWSGNEIKPVLDTLIGQGGFTLFRVVFDNSDWATSSNLTQASYNNIYGSARFEKLWSIVGYLNQKGLSNGVFFNFQGPGPSWMGGGTLTPGYESQWAQMITSLLVYARNARHLQFNLVAPDNEPDLNGQLVGVGAGTNQYVTMLHQLALNLNSNGLSDIRVIGPELGLVNQQELWFEKMMGDPLVMSKLGHFGIHSYLSQGQGTDGVASYLASTAYSNSTFWVTEFNSACGPCYQGTLNTNNYSWSFCSATAEFLLYHLANGATGGLVWDAYDSYYELQPLPWLPQGQQASGWGYFGLFGIDNTNAVPRTYTARKNFYTLSQISAFVPPGSQRVAVGGGQTASLMMLAFYHPASGRVTLTGFNNGNAMSLPITLTNLPPVTNFALYYTDPNTNLSLNAAYPVVNGNFTANIPSNCIFTLTGFDPAKIAVSVQLTNPANGAQFAAPATIPLAATVATTTGSITNVVFLSGASGIGATTNTPCGITWSNVTPGTYTVTAAATDTMGHTNVSPAITLTVTGPPAQIVISPTNATTISNGQVQFSAIVEDALGNPVSPQPALTWSAAGGLIDPDGWFLASSNTGGPFAVVATNSGLSGSANVLLTNNLNIAPNGIGYIWYNLFTNTGNTPQTDAPLINDGDTTTAISLLLSPYDGYQDFTNAWEGAGVIWPAPQTITSVVYFNGATIGANGTFNSGFQLQFTSNGSAWFPASPQWALSPAYHYNTASSSPVQYDFSGSPTTVLGFRCVGMVNSGHGQSGDAYATEVQAYLGLPPPPAFKTTFSKNTGLVVSWSSAMTNCVLLGAPDLNSPWTTVTNARQYTGPQTSVTIQPPGDQQYFRLYFP